jgi:ribonuclease P protein subunit POP4
MLKGSHYTITKENVVMHEIIGLKADVVESSDAGRKGIKGTVIDETKNVFVLECADGSIRRIPKDESVFEFDIGGEKAVIKGSLLVARPHERTKMLGGKAYGGM